MILSSYFDGSGKREDRRVGHVALAGVIAADEDWVKIERDWQAILSSHVPSARYLHMKEAAHLHGEFSRANGWDDKAVRHLVDLLLAYLSKIPKHVIYSACCLVHKETYDRYLVLGKIPEDLSYEHQCLNHVLRYNALWAGGVNDESRDYPEQIYCHYDKGESFAKYAFRLHERLSKSNVAIATIRNMVVQGLRDDKPVGIQIADLVAWSAVRCYDGSTERPYSDLWDLVMKAIPGRGLLLDLPGLENSLGPLGVIIVP